MATQPPLTDDEISRLRSLLKIEDIRKTRLLYSQYMDHQISMDSLISLLNRHYASLVRMVSGGAGKRFAATTKMYSAAIALSCFTPCITVTTTGLNLLLTLTRLVVRI